jgi:hypothetical protein
VLLTSFSAQTERKRLMNESAAKRNSFSTIPLFASGFNAMNISQTLLEPPSPSGSYFFG